MKKLLKNKNVLLVIVMLLVCAAVLAFSGLLDSAPDTLPQNLPASEQKDAAASLAEDAGMPRGYILVQKNGDGGWIPLPASESMTVTISDENDAEMKNVIRLTPNGFLMESSTCDNQDCVDQGEVTLENMNERVLMNMVICLPHQLSVELYTIEQLVEMSTAN